MNHESCFVPARVQKPQPFGQGFACLHVAKGQTKTTCPALLALFDLNNSRHGGVAAFVIRGRFSLDLNISRPISCPYFQRIELKKLSSPARPALSSLVGTRNVRFEELTLSDSFRLASEGTVI